LREEEEGKGKREDEDSMYLPNALTNETTRRQNPTQSQHHTNRRENIKSHRWIYVYELVTRMQNNSEDDRLLGYNAV
jgi:hypothetical protein